MTRQIGGAAGAHRAPQVLVVYAYHRYPARVTTWDHLYCFARSPHCVATYLNLRYRRVSRRLLRRRFDLVVFDTTFLGQRWSRERFRQVAQRALPLRDLDAVKVMIPQDEFLNTDLLCDFVNDMGINHVFTNLAPADWTRVYDRVDHAGVGFTRVLTGYLEPRTVDRIARLAARAPARDLDIGYRAAAFPWFGRHGMNKVWVAERVRDKAQALGLTVDLDERQRGETGRLHGDAWYAFLLRCRYTLGAEGGTSVHDRDGAIRARTEDYLARHPGADFAEVEAACFPGRDGDFDLRALSPRHLEACATRTCQILLEGAYDGILEPGRHYLELKADYSNLDEVMRQVAEDSTRLALVDRAHADVVASGRYGYDAFVRQVLERALGGRPRVTASAWQRRAWRPLMRVADALTWIVVWAVDRFAKPKN